MHEPFCVFFSVGNIFKCFIYIYRHCNIYTNSVQRNSTVMPRGVHKQHPSQVERSVRVYWKNLWEADVWSCRWAVCTDKFMSVSHMSHLCVLVWFHDFVVVHWVWTAGLCLASCRFLWVSLSVGEKGTNRMTGERGRQKHGLHITQD